MKYYDYYYYLKVYERKNDFREDFIFFDKLMVNVWNVGGKEMILNSKFNERCDLKRREVGMVKCRFGF